MSSTVTILPPTSLANANHLLRRSTQCWFIITVLGQWIFATYITVFYGGAAAGGQFDQWNDVLSPGYQEGHTMGNIAVGMHLLLAVFIIVGGPLQFIPLIRQRFVAFHRWNGRIYVMLTMLTGMAGLYMIWFHQQNEASVNLAAMTIEGILMLLAGILVWRFAVKRKFQQHERWAMRLFLLASGVWFFRIGLMFWFFINQGPVGVDTETFTGPFITFISYAHYLLPLAIYELYLLVTDHGKAGARYSMAALMVICTLASLIGIFAATMQMWLPRM